MRPTPKSRCPRHVLRLRLQHFPEASSPILACNWEARQELAQERAASLQRLCARYTPSGCGGTACGSAAPCGPTSARTKPAGTSGAFRVQDTQLPTRQRADRNCPALRNRPRTAILRWQQVELKRYAVQQREDHSPNQNAECMTLHLAGVNMRFLGTPDFDGRQRTNSTSGSNLIVGVRKLLIIN